MPDSSSLDELGRQQSLLNFPPERRWEKVEGVVIRQRSKADDHPLISIVGRDHKGAEVVGFWTDLPNAMHLLKMLEDVQLQTRAKIPTRPPGNCAAYDGN
jgi:hypothetical protein